MLHLFALEITDLRQTSKFSADIFALNGLHRPFHSVGIVGLRLFEEAFLRGEPPDDFLNGDSGRLDLSQRSGAFLAIGALSAQTGRESSDYGDQCGPGGKFRARHSSYPATLMQKFSKPSGLNKAGRASLV